MVDRHAKMKRANEYFASNVAEHYAKTQKKNELKSRNLIPLKENDRGSAAGVLFEVMQWKNGGWTRRSRGQSPCEMRTKEIPRVELWVLFCYGTRLICTSLSRYVLEATIVTGTHVGNWVFIPHITNCFPDIDMPFKFQRLQFHVRPAFAMTIKKSQGQTLDIVGIHLKKPVFAHGQLYVALSRVTSKNRVHVLVEREDAKTPYGCTTAVVYPDILAWVSVFFKKKKKGLQGRDKGQSVTNRNKYCNIHLPSLFLHLLHFRERSRGHYASVVKRKSTNRSVRVPFMEVMSFFFSFCK